MPNRLLSHRSWLVRYAAALAAVGLGALVRLGLTALVGEGLPTYITFYPAVMVVALAGGFGPGLVATALTAVLARYWLLAPVGQFAIERPVDAVGLAFFAGMGLFISMVASLYRRARQRAAVYAKQIPPWARQEEDAQPLGERLLLNGGLLLALAVLALTGWRAHRSMAMMEQADRLVTHTYAVNEQIEHFLMALEEMHASVRGYVVTGQEESLRAYAAAWPESTNRLAALKAQTRDNPAQTQRMGQLEALMSDRRATLQEIIELRRTRGFEAAQAQMATGEGRALAEEIRRLMDETQAEEDRLLRARTQAKESSLRRAGQTLLSGALLAVLILAAVFVFLARENAARRHAQAELRRHRDHLQDIVTARTAELAEANESLRRQREWLQVTLSSIGDAVLASDTAGRITFLNPVAEALTGWGEPEALGQPVQTVFRTVNEDTREPGEDIHARVLREGGIVALANHTALIARDGREVPIEDSAAPIKDTAGTVSGVVLVFHDVTEKRRAQAAMRESQRQSELLAGIVERAAQPLGVGYLDGRLGLFNRAFEELTGYTAEELRAMDWTKTLTPPEWRELEGRKLEELQRTGQAVRYEKEYLRKDGRRVPIELLVHLARDGAGNPEYFYSFITDITARKQAEEQLRRSAAELQETNLSLGSSRRAALNLMEDALQARKAAEAASADLRSLAEQRRLALEAADLGAWDYHFQTGEVFWDERCREMWGMAQSEQTDYSTAISRIHPEDRAGVDQAVQEALAGREGGAFHREFRVVWPDGSVHWIASHGRVYFEGEGDARRPIRFIGANLDVTAEKHTLVTLEQTAEDLKRSNRDLEQFAYVASHDLQEPLRAVGGYVKLIERHSSGTLDARAREFIAGAFDGALRMERLIQDLLAFSRVGTRAGDFAPVNLETVLQHTLANLQSGIQSAQAVITHDPLPTLRVDATQFMQLFQNLLGNALKFRGEAPPRIHVGVQTRDGRRVFSVRDNGIGVEPEYFERIFQLFQRLHTRKQYAGTGLGLAICKRIVERHGGAIWVESQPGHGSTFFFSIPEAGSR